MATGYNFTERVRKVLAMAREEAHALQHEYVGTEHILLGLIADGGGVASAVLQSLEIDMQKLRSNILDIVAMGKPSGDAGSDLPYTSRSKKVLELSMSEARELSHSYVGTEHLLLALIREEKGVAAQVLIVAGATLPKVRMEVVRLLGTPDASHDEGKSTIVPRPNSTRPIAAVEITVHYHDGSRKEQLFPDARSAIRHLLDIQ